MEARHTERLRLSKSDRCALQEVFDSCRFVWNTALGRWQDLWRYEGLNLSWIDMSKELTDWRSRFDWLAAIPRSPQKQVLRHLGQSIQAFHDPQRTTGRPHFKKREMYQTATWDTGGFSIHNDRLLIAVKGGRQGVSGRIDLRVVWSRPLPSIPKSVTIYRDAAGHWWASFVVRIEPENTGITGQTTGLDLGLTTFATTEFADADVPNPRFARNKAKALARSQRSLSRKKKGSKNRAKAKITTAKVHAHTANQRKDWQFKEARKLARRFDRIGVEDLRIKNMVKNHRLARSINDAGWGNFLRTLEWQAKKCGHEVIRINPRNTTQTCSCCGTKAKSPLGLADRIFVCSECDYVEDRDRNAARNLNPNRWGKSGEGVDGKKTLTLASVVAARVPESLIPL